MAPGVGASSGRRYPANVRPPRNSGQIFAVTARSALERSIFETQKDPDTPRVGALCDCSPVELTPALAGDFGEHHTRGHRRVQRLRRASHRDGHHGVAVVANQS
jgi:hypothetical protein